jgi:hypothetical protein
MATRGKSRGGNQESHNKKDSTAIPDRMRNHEKHHVRCHERPRNRHEHSGHPAQLAVIRRMLVMIVGGRSSVRNDTDSPETIFAIPEC